MKIYTYLIEFFSVPIAQIPRIGKIVKNAKFSCIHGILAFFAIFPVLRYLHFWDFLCVICVIGNEKNWRTVIFPKNAVLDLYIIRHKKFISRKMFERNRRRCVFYPAL